MIAARPACRTLLLLACLSLSGLSPASAADEPAQQADAALGRLFHSRQQRAIFDDLRRRNAHIGREQESDSIALQGIVRRSSGASTVWINGRAHHERAPVASVGARSARVFVGDGKTVELKVGERIELAPSAAKP